MPGTYAPPAVELPNTREIVGIPAALRAVRSWKMLAGGDEQVGLGGQVGAPGLDQIEHGEAVDPGDLEGPKVLAKRVRVHRSAPHGRIVGDDDALGTADHADAGDDRRAELNSVPHAASVESSRKADSASTSSSIRSRTVSRPRDRCRATYFSPPPPTAIAFCSSSLPISSSRATRFAAYSSLLTSTRLDNTVTDWTPFFRSRCTRNDARRREVTLSL